MILLKGGSYLSPKCIFEKADILIADEKIQAIESNIEPKDSYTNVDLKGDKVIPGFIDIHMHGALGYDVMTANPSQIIHIADHLAKEGTTSFFPTTITADIKEIGNAIQNIQQASGLNKSGASIEGIHVEGPYINPKQKGCHDTTKMKSPDFEEYEEFKSLAGDLKLHMTVAPELSNSIEFIEYASKDNSTMGIGHSDGDYDTIREALNHGARIFTHLFNAMKGIHHREPGVAGAALLSDAYVELICDGIHVHPDNIQLVYRLKGKDKIILVSDAMQAKGLGDGRYQFGGFTVVVSKGIARKEDGSLASSTLSMFEAVKNMARFADIGFEEAVQMATLNPARAVGIDDITGSVEAGKRADLIVIDKAFKMQSVFCRGKRVL